MKQYGSAYASGGFSIKGMMPLLELMGKKVFMFTDSDDSSVKAKKEYTDKGGYCSDLWRTFIDLNGECKDYTIEDFITDDLLQRAVDSQQILVTISPRTVPIMKLLAKEQRNKRDAFKRYIVENLTQDNIKEQYYNVLEVLNTFIKENQT